MYRYINEDIAISSASNNKVAWGQLATLASDPKGSRTLQARTHIDIDIYRYIYKDIAI